MSIRSSSLVWDHSRAKGTALLVLLVIADHDGEGGAWPSIGTIARAARVSESTARRAIRELEQLGELRVELRGGGTHSTPDRVRPNRYVITIPPPEQPYPSSGSTPPSPPPYSPAALGLEPVDNSAAKPVDNTPVTGDTPVMGDRGTPCTGDRGTPVTAVTPEPSLEPSTEPPPTPAVPKLPEQLARFWTGEGISNDDQTQLWRALLADPATQSPMRRGLQPAWYVPELARIHGRAGKAVGDAITVVRRFGELCPHDEPGGADLHPNTGLPLCPLCRAAARAGGA